MQDKAFSKIGIIVILIILIGGGYFGWQYFGMPKEDSSLEQEDVQDNFEETNELSDEELLRYANSSFNETEMVGKDIIIGYHHGIPVRVTFPCYDGYTTDPQCFRPSLVTRIIRYDTDIFECDKYEGVAKRMYIPSITRYASLDDIIKAPVWFKEEDFCFPKVLVDNKIYFFGDIVMYKDATEATEDSIYRNEECGFEFEIPSIFQEIGYKIILEDKETLSRIYSEPSEMMARITFETRPIPPNYTSVDEKDYGGMFFIFINSQEYCENEGKESCDEIRTGERLFRNYLAENEDYFCSYNTGGTSGGDMWSAWGWDKEEVGESVQSMLSTFRFLE